MKRSGSKLIAKAGSVKNISKAGFRFAFELQIESVDQMLGTSDVVVTWERGPKLVATMPYKVNKSKRAVAFDGASLKQDVTMFKKKKADAAFEAKVFRLSVRQGSETGKAVGKIDLNFADYAELPSFSKRIGAPLSSGSRLVLRVNSRYLGEVEKKSRKFKKPSTDDDTSSVASDSTLDGGNGNYSVTAAEELDERKQVEQDLDDLMLDNTDSAPVSKEPHGVGRHGGGGGGGGGGGMNGAPTLSVASDQRERGPRSREPPAPWEDPREPFGRKPLARAPTMMGTPAVQAPAPISERYNDGSVRRTAERERYPGRAERARQDEGGRYGDGGRGAYRSNGTAPGTFMGATDSHSDRGRGPGGHTAERYDGRNGTSEPAPSYEPGGASRAEIERIRAENKSLRRENDKLREQLADAESRGGGGDPDARDNELVIRDLKRENNKLQRDIEELQERLSREPVYVDVVRDLRESKMALAILTMERDELHQSLRQKGDSSTDIASRNLL